MKDFKAMNLFDDSSDADGLVVGIDLGTTNSACAICRNKNIPEIIGNRRTMPSCVMWTGNPREFIVGEEAYLHRDEPHVAYSTKRFMGTDKDIVLKHGEKTLTMKPEEVASEILKELMRRVREDYPNATDAVITVPATFGTKQIKATVTAGKLAGINVRQILREPTAVSLVYSVDKFSKKKEEYILVYDLGGGTFDISLVRITKVDTPRVKTFLHDVYDITDREVSDKPIISVIANDGSRTLGGDDLDLEIYKIIKSKFEALGYKGIEIPFATKERLLLDIIDFKKAGPDIRMTTNIKFQTSEGKKIEEKITLTPEDYKKASRVIYKETKKYVDRVMSTNPNIAINYVLLAGGSTKNVYIKEFLKEDYPTSVFADGINADEAVALGAGIKGKLVQCGNEFMDIFDITPNAIGIGTSRGTVDRLIKRNQVVPVSKTKLFTTSKDDQESVIVRIYEGNSILLDECQVLGDLVIDNLPKGKVGEVRLGITLSIDSLGMLKCFVRLDDRVMEKSLVNIFAGEDKEDVPNNTIILSEKDRKKLARWRSFAYTLQDEYKDRLTEVLDSFEFGDLDIKSVMNFVKEMRPFVDSTKTRDGISSDLRQGMEVASGRFASTVDKQLQE